MEFLCGLKEPRYLQDLAARPDELGRLARRLEEPSVWDGFRSLLGRHGLPMPEDDADARRESLLTMARDRAHAALFAVSEGLLDHDESFSTWRYHHVLMVEHEIGAKRGTGGSSGVAYLRRRSTSGSSPSSGSCGARSRAAFRAPGRRGRGAGSGARPRRRDALRLAVLP